MLADPSQWRGLELDLAAGTRVRVVLDRLGEGRSWWALVTDGDGGLGALVSSDVDGLMEVVTG